MYKDENQLDDFFGLKPDGEEKPHKIRSDSWATRVRNRIRLIPKVLSFKERYLIFAFLLIAIGSIISIPFTAYHHFTKEAPNYGSSFNEGIVGEPRHVNPLLSQTNDADRDLVSLVYSGLMKYSENGKLVPDLAKSYEISSDGLNYTIYLRDDALWHDGTKVTADDVVYTIRTAQDSDYGSTQKINWLGVEVEKINDTTLMFKLKNKYAQFLNNLTIGILPMHIWQDIKPINFALSDYNLKPIGSGPYKFKKIVTTEAGIKSYQLESNNNYYSGRPYIDNITFSFYGSEDEMIDAYNKNEISNISFVSPENLKKVKFQKRINIQRLEMPRYFAAFFNLNQSTILGDKNIRLALNRATDKKDLINKVLNGEGLVVDSPLIPGILDISTSIKKYDFDIDAAKKILEASGWGNPNKDGILTKKKETLKLKLTTSSWPELSMAANILKEQWKKIGVDLEVEALPTPALQQAIKERNYEILLFGEILNIDPDPFSLWHSSQKREPGLNLALYDNKTADTLLEEARQTLNPLERINKYNDLQNLIIDDMPAVFLYDPIYLYNQTKDIKGYNNKIISMPSDRFSNVEKWYISTKRTFNK